MGRHPDRTLPVDITSMVDVVFLLIAFFLTTAQFARMTRADIDLPREAGEGSRDEEPGMIINLLASGTIVVDDVEYDLAGLKQLLVAEIKAQREQRGEKINVTVRADRTLSSARLNQVVRAMQEMGIGLGRFATEVPR